MKLNKSQFFKPKPPTTIGNELDETAPPVTGQQDQSGPDQVDYKPNADLEAANRQNFFK